jgi:hypothetical protein
VKRDRTQSPLTGSDVRLLWLYAGVKHRITVHCRNTVRKHDTR